MKIMEELDDVIEFLTEEFKKTIPTEESELVKKFKEHLFSTIKYLKNSKSNFIGEKKDAIKFILKRDAQFYINLPTVESKKKELMNDENLEQLKISSALIFKIACKKLNNKIKNKNIDLTKELEKMKKLMDNVEPYNKEEAATLYSEAILDAEYIENSNTNFWSLRLYQEYKMINFKDEEER